MSLWSGSPGGMRFSMPSRPASIMTANERYGLHDGSGVRNSMRLAFGDDENIGMRIAAERLRAEYARFTGASKPGVRRRYEFVDGLVKAQIVLACLMMPPM